MYKHRVNSSDHFHNLQAFFSKAICQKAAGPLRNDLELAIDVGSLSTFALSKKNNSLVLEDRHPKTPDISFFLGEEVPQLLNDFAFEDFSEIGIFILQLMLEKEPSKKVKAKVHIPPLKMVRNGYFGILALGGAPLMGFLAKKGLGSFSQIKNALSHLRS